MAIGDPNIERLLLVAIAQVRGARSGYAGRRRPRRGRNPRSEGQTDDRVGGHVFSPTARVLQIGEPTRPVRGGGSVLAGSMSIQVCPEMLAVPRYDFPVNQLPPGGGLQHLGVSPISRTPDLRFRRAAGTAWGSGGHGAWNCSKGILRWVPRA